MTVFNDGENPTYPVQRLMSVTRRHASRYSLTKLGDAAITSSCYRLKIRVRLAVRCERDIQLPSTVFRRVEFASNVPPQLQLIVVDGSQYAALAKLVNGENTSIWEVLRVVIA